MNLEDLKVATPCRESWDSMTGDERARHCAKCDHSVYNIVDMTRQEALDFVHSREGGKRTCIRLHRRFDGTVITRDCPVGIRRRRLSLVGKVSAVVAGAAVATTVTAVSAMSGARSDDTGEGVFRRVYLSAKVKFLDSCDQISHKFGITSLCNCSPVSFTSAVYVTAGMMCIPPSSGAAPMPGDPAFPEDPEAPNPFDPPESDPFAPLPEEDAGGQ